MRAAVPYRFNVINCEKPNSQFNYGMSSWGTEVFWLTPGMMLLWLFGLLLEALFGFPKGLKLG